MILLGAGGHARELLDIISKDCQNVYLFDNYTQYIHPTLYDFTIFTSINEVKKVLEVDNKIALATGNVKLRHTLYDQFKRLNGTFPPIISSSAIISKQFCDIQEGVNIMHLVFISNNTSIGIGTLINSRVNIHHDVRIGDFCEIGPGAIILGNVQIKKSTFIGAGAIILPGVEIGENCVVGAGSIVTKSIKDNTLIKGIAAR
jgi:sugar O-acyltransferase (sialic acid O-acetyltransferase NeuD family)